MQNFPEKTHMSQPLIHIKGKEMSDFLKILRTYYMNDPLRKNKFFSTKRTKPKDGAYDTFLKSSPMLKTSQNVDLLQH